MVSGMKLPDHSHCGFCGDPIPFGEEYCDDTCREADAERQRKERNKEYRFWGSAGVICAIVIIVAAVMRL
ncbi:MAG: DUF2116 family Zn-ribbon domain-containing protein [Thermoplasmata archaeon]|nr:DUF2116 family Zn-ribbon domain-containing protein [Thermoplasmata archaeon]